MIFLNKMFEEDLSRCLILKALEREVRESHFCEYLSELPGLFPMINHANPTESVLSQYGKCDFYGFHKDDSKTFEREKRRDPR